MARSPAFLRFVDALLRARWWVLALVAAATAAAAFLASRLTTNNDYQNWLPENDRVAELFKETDREFSSNAILFVVLDFEEKGAFHPESLRGIQTLTKLLEGMPELFSVLSLSNVVDIRGAGDGLAVGRLFRKVPEDPDEIARLERYVLSKEMYRNSVVSRDARYAAILLNIDGDYDEVSVAGKVLETLEKNATAVSTTLGGDPALTYYADRTMVRDLETLVPFMMLVIVVVLALGLKSVTGVVLPALTVVLCIVWTLGFQGLFRLPLNLMTPGVLVLLIAMGSDYAVHVANHHRKSGDIRTAGAEIAVPVLMSAVTTVASLLTFATTRIKILIDFGVELAFGLGAACVLALSFVIVALEMLGRRRRGEAAAAATGEPRDEDLLDTLLGKLATRVLAHHRIVLVVAAVLLAAMAVGIPRIRTNVDYATLLPEESPPRVASGILQRHFGGMYPLSLYFRGDMEDPALLAFQLRLESYLRGHAQLEAFSSIAGVLAEMNRQLSGFRAIPEDRAGVASLWLLVEGEAYLRTLVNEDRDKALVTAMVRDSDTGVMKEIARFVEREVPAGTSTSLLVLDPDRLPSGSRARLHELRVEEASEQLAWLASRYGPEGDATPHSPVEFRRAIDSEWPRAGAEAALAEVERELGGYLEKDALRPLDHGLAARVAASIVAHISDPDPKAAEGRLAEAHDSIASEGHVPSAEAEPLVEASLRRGRELWRAARTRRLEAAVLAGLPAPLRTDHHFAEHAGGVLWELTNPRPGLLEGKAAGIGGLEAAVERRVPFQLDQTGAPDLFRKFDELLYRSQGQSLVLATIAVFLLVSATQRSIRRGLVSTTAILVPLGIVMGFMGWAGIPLDFGTALFGALIIGLGIDGCIHIMQHEIRAVERGVPPEKALADSFRHVGRAILTANATTAGGFFVLVFSATPALDNFAWLTTLAIVLVTVSVLTLLPALIRAGRVFRDRPVP